jgi:hypothetical protein
MNEATNGSKRHEDESVPVDQTAALWMLLAIAVICLVNWFFGEKTFIRHGLGWDGELYGNIAKDLNGYVFGHHVEGYRLQRIAPTAVVVAGLRLLGFPITDALFIRGFELLNACLLLTAAVLWVIIARSLRLERKAGWLGFVALFVNYAVQKQIFFLPVNTDAAALTLSLLILYLFFSGRRLALFAIGLIGSFVWPTVSLSVALLLLFPRRLAIPAPDENRGYAAGASLLLAAFMLSLLGYLYFYTGRRSAGMGPVVPIVGNALFLSAILFAAYIVLAITRLLDGVGPRYVYNAARAVRPVNLLLAVAVVTVPTLVVRALADPSAPPTLPTRTFLGYLALMPISRPLIFLVSHIIYFGPAILLIVILWKKLADDAKALGPGIVSIVFLAIVFSFHAESRISIFAYPFLVALLVPHLRAFARTPGAFWSFVVISIVLSKFWLPINAWLPEGRATDMGLPLHFMNHGAWMQNWAYLVHLSAVALSALILWRTGGDALRSASSVRSTSRISRETLDAHVTH